MSCTRFRESRGTGAADDHAAACVACAEWLAGQRRATAALAQLAAGLDAAVRPADREAELRGAFRQATASAVPRRGSRSHWALAAAAACLVGALGLAALGRTPGRQTQRAAPAARVEGAAAALRSTAPVRPASPAVRRGYPPVASASARHAVVAVADPAGPTSSARSAARPADAPIVAPPSPVAPVKSADAVVTSADAAAAALRASAGEDAFYPLLTDSGPAALDSGQILRVQLRADVLEAAGLTPRSGAQGPVEAEVLVGPDGVARGIRVARPRR